MSTEHQQYSPENQLEIIRQYAADHYMEIVQDYSDHGRSGLNIAGRDGLNQLMADVEASLRRRLRDNLEAKPKPRNAGYQWLRNRGQVIRLAGGDGIG